MRKVRFFRQNWFLVLIGGLVLFILTDWALNSTGNPNFLPTVILIGAFLVPVTFVFFIYHRVPPGEIPIPTVVVTFLWGGALGAVVAGILEYQTIRQLGIPQLFGVGLIEEAAKLILPVAIFLRGRFRHEADGLLFGVAAGMGFAALETMGYGFVSFLQSQGSVGTLNQTLLIRGLLSPVGHAAWTGIVCAALWRPRERLGHIAITWTVFGTFILAIVLHASWDILGSISSLVKSNLGWLDIIGIVVVGGISLWLLIRKIRMTHHGQVKIVTQGTSIS